MTEGICNMYKPDLSIIVPVFNMEKYLKECVDSLLMQTYNSYELILVDDGSTDSSTQICNEYGKDARVKVIHKNNGGIISARKAGLTVAEGEYIGFIDSDDWIDKTMYEEMMSCIEESGADVAICGYVRENENSSIVYLNQCKEGYYDKKRMEEEIYPGLIAYGTDWVNQRIIPPHLVDKVFKRELIRDVYNGMDDRVVWCEDMVTVYPAILSAQSMYVINKAFYHYRKNTLSVSFRKDRRALDLYPLVIKELLKTCDKYGGNLEEQLGYCFAYDMAEMLRLVFGMNHHKLYLFPYEIFDKGERIVIYGAGAVGWSYYHQINQHYYLGDVIWTDSNKEKHNGEIVAPSKAFDSEYDKVLIAVENKDVALQIKDMLVEKYYIPDGKICWKRPEIVEGTFSYHYD